MKKLLAFILWLPVCAFAQVPPPAPASVQDVIDGTATYKFISPATLSGAGITGGGGGGGGWISNEVRAASLSVLYTNTTPHNSIIWARYSTASSGGNITAFVTNNSGTLYNTFTTYQVGGGGGVTNTISFNVPSGYWFKVDTNAVSVIASPVLENLNITYFSTNSSGGGSGDVTAAGLAAGDYPIEADALTGLASINTTGNAAGATNLAGKVFVMNNGIIKGGYTTISNAIAAAVSGDTVWVMPGTYAENNLAKDGIKLKGEIGANIVYLQTTTNDAGYAIIDDRGKGPIRMTFDWPGAMTLIGVTNTLLCDTNDFFPLNLNPNTVGVISHTNPASQYLGNIGEISGGDYMETEFFLWSSPYGSNSVLKVSRMVDVLEGIPLDRAAYFDPNQPENFVYSAVSGWFTGASIDYFELHCPYIKATGSYCWYWLEPGDAARTNDFYLYSGYTKGIIYGTSSNTTYRGWMTGGTLHQGQISCYGGGRWYFDVQKIEAGVATAFNAAKAYGNTVSNGINYIRAMKVESSTRFIDASSSTTILNVDDWTESVGGTIGADGILTSGNAVIVPHYSLSGRTNIAAAAASLVIYFPRIMPGTNYVPSVTFGFNPVTTVQSYTGLTRSNFTVNFNAGVTTGGRVNWTATQAQQ